jgi:hypothetical protein
VGYGQGKMRIGLWADGIPVNIFVDLILIFTMNQTYIFVLYLMRLSFRFAIVISISLHSILK